MRENIYDKIIIGAGLYGLYSALLFGKKGNRVLVLECDLEPFQRASYINQARVHQGYHYPRSLSTAKKSAGYFARFNKDFGFCINREFEQIYATSSTFSWTNGEQFKNFCASAEIPCREVAPKQYFNKGMCDSAFITREYTYDAKILSSFYTEKLSELPNVSMVFNAEIREIDKGHERYSVLCGNGEKYETGFLLNTSYASSNQILRMLDLTPFKIKYELCEIILCKANGQLKEYGFTVMDGPFFSIMPFGSTGLHSLTSVTFTPHTACFEDLPTFRCQKDSGGYCCPERLGNCNFCPAKPKSAFPYMNSLARKYLKEEYSYDYQSSLFSMKPIMKSSEIDDSRPTVIRKYTDNPTFISVLSGKINTVYDLDDFLE